MHLSIWCTLLLSFSCCAAEKAPYEEWLDFKEAFAGYASGPTGMYAIQHMIELQPGEAAYLPNADDTDSLRWSKSLSAGGPILASVTYQNGQAIVSGSSIRSTDLLKVVDRQMELPNKLTVRVSFLDERALKVWLYNPRRLAASGFEGLAYFPYSPQGVIDGAFHAREPLAVTYLDSREHTGTMYEVGRLQVTIAGRKYDLPAFSYKNTWSEIEELLLLLKDRTTGKTTYGGGRVVDIRFPKGTPPSNVRVNLNTAYSFLCAHSEYYNCPLVLTKTIDAELNFGEKYPPLRRSPR